MKTCPFAIVALLGSLLLAGCDDEESRSNVPPDLRLEDVVGCWYSNYGACKMLCYDSSLQGYFQMKWLDGSHSEITSRFWFSGYFIVEEFRSGTMKEGVVDTMKDGYQRVGNNLYSVGYDYGLANRYDPVNLDSTFPCGIPFTILPKPKGWTLF